MNYRRALIRFFTFIGGAYFFLQFVLPSNIGGFQFGKFHEQISEGLVLMGAAAVGLGFINLMMVHGSRLVYLRGGWFNSLVLLTGLALMLAVTWSDFVATNRIASGTARIELLRDFSAKIAKDEAEDRADRLPLERRNEALLKALAAETAKVEADLKSEGVAGDDPSALHETAAALEQVRKTAGELSAASADAQRTMNVALVEPISKFAAAYKAFQEARYQRSSLKSVYNFLNEGFYYALGAAMFSLLGFYVATAAYRAFRIKSRESAFMMFAALVVMLGQIPFGIRIWEGFPDLRLWLLQVPSSGAFRAIEVGASIAGLVLAFRMWLSIESESFKR